MNENTEGILNLLHSLRTIHGDFADMPVREEDMQTILKACVRAANSSSRQCYSIIRLQERGLMKEICTYSAPQALLFLADYTRLRDVADSLGYELIANTLDDLVTPTIDASLAAQNAVIAAKTLGLDSMVTNAVLRGDPTRFKRLLNLPDHGCMPLFAVLFGYPQEEPEHRHGRYLGPGLLHSGAYRRMSEEQLAAMLSEYDDPQKHMGLSFVDWRARGFKSYFEWFFKAWAPARLKNAPAEEAGKARLRPDNARILAEQAGFLKKT